MYKSFIKNNHNFLFCHSAHFLFFECRVTIYTLEIIEIRCNLILQVAMKIYLFKCFISALIINLYFYAHAYSVKVENSHLFILLILDSVFHSFVLTLRLSKYHYIIQLSLVLKKIINDRDTSIRIKINTTPHII